MGNIISCVLIITLIETDAKSPTRPLAARLHTTTASASRTSREDAKTAIFSARERQSFMERLNIPTNLGQAAAF